MKTLILSVPALMLSALIPAHAASQACPSTCCALIQSRASSLAATPKPTAPKPATPNQVTLKASTDLARYTPGQPIEVRLSAANISRKPATLSFSSGQRFDFSVYKLGQREPAYTWSASRMFSQIVGSLTLRPGQKQDFEAAIGDEMGSLGPGRYRLLARLSNSPRPVVAAAIAFEIVDLGLSIAARTDKTSYKIGEPVQIDIAVANRLARENTVPFGSGLSFDVLIRDEAGRLVWTYGANLRFIRVLGSMTWRKGETKNFSAVWNGVALPGQAPQPPALKPGRYRVQALLASTPLLLAAPIDIEITS